ncbi:LAG1-domain-containing protein [Tilletiaria anomala UBC 951]|uniref:LAG1-domain-containing protein n=1 Tax=Tilletiaria anomala (strain ATCC 24038 / CBS 436.72 / UBC 951) TaxID=1037660 RepID=A0A066VFE6_TILAU|nr:LAG1-domain-containing protein [Tilletiaria anomala UBC 951]KDN40447.1 LAG1-domain-containing protein [Tilletiaria anomala UBC 951]
MHAISSSEALHSINLLPHSLQSLLPNWVHSLPQLSPYDADVPNASHDYTTSSTYSRIFSAGPFKSDAAGFGHPLSALHWVTKAFLGLSYPVAGGRFADVVQKTQRHVGGAAGLWSIGSSSVSDASGRAWEWLLEPANQLYDKGPADLLYVLTWVLIWTAVRAAIIKHVLIPLGNRWVVKRVVPPCKAHRKETQEQVARLNDKSVLRFAEQGWCVLFYVPSLSLSLWVASRQPYWPLKTEHLWIGYPHAQIDGLTKFYYLAQLGFWLHQIFVLNVETKRKDYLQMFAHHIITVALIVFSYFTNYTRIGNMILCLMDPSDILLSAAKCLRYVGLQTICDIGFGLFLVSWVITRHVLYNILLWSAAVESRRFIVQTWIPEQGWFYTDRFILFMVSLLCALQVLLCIWFVMIARVAYRVVTGAPANDSRSDDETDGELELKPEQLDQRDVSEASKKEATKKHAGRKSAASVGDVAPAQPRSSSLGASLSSSGTPSPAPASSTSIAKAASMGNKKRR